MSKTIRTGKSDLTNPMNPESAVSRRVFLQRASLILASAAIAPALKRDLFRVLKDAVLPTAQAATAGYEVDFVLEIGAPASIPWGDLFPPTSWIRPDTHPDRGSCWAPNELRAHQLSNGRTILTTDGANALRPHVENCAIIESMDEYIGAHPGIWPLRAGGWYVGHAQDRRNESNYGACLASLFAATVASKRGANSSPIPGMWRGTGIDHCNGTRKALPSLVPMQLGTAQFSAIFAANPRTQSRSELRRVLDTINEINAYQVDERLRLRITEPENLKTASQQGMALVSTQKVIDIAAEFATYRTQFFAGPGQDAIPMPSRPTEAYNPADRQLGEALLISFLGFKHNLIGATSIGIVLGHPHFAIPQLGDNSTREAIRYTGDRVGALVSAAKATPHPFRPGKNLFDHMLIMITTDTHRDVAMNEKDDDGNPRDSYHWGEDDRKGCVLIGGAVKGGYLGDCPFPRGGRANIVEGFDFNTGAVNPRSRPSPPSIYRTVAEAAGIPASEIQAQMGPGYGAATIPALFK